MLNGWISGILHIITSNARGAIKWLLRDFYLTTQRKVTRQAAQRRRNPVEDGVLASCMAKPCQYLVAGQRRYPIPSPLPQGQRGLLPRTITLR